MNRMNDESLLAERRAYMREYHPRWSAKPENKVKIAGYQAKYRAKRIAEGPEFLERERELQRQSRAKRDPAELSARRRKRAYGVTPEEFAAKLAEQGNACPICHRPFTDNRRPYVDHDRSCCPGNDATCGRCVRGLLCVSCNTLEGRASDERIVAILEYRRIWSAAHGGQVPS